MLRICLLIVLSFHISIGKIDSEEDFMDTGEQDLSNENNVTTKYNNDTRQKNEEDRDDDSGERIGASVTQIFRHPYAASVLKNDSYVCSAVVLNTYWLLTLSKCFDSDVISSYVTHRYLGNYTVRTGSSYNNKGGYISQIKMLINNFDVRVSALKLSKPLEFGPRVSAVDLPHSEDEPSLGYLASMLAWTPSGHMRVVNAPVIDSSICEPSTKLLPGRYVCVGGVQDPNRHFCRRDNGGAVIQNNTLIAIASFLHTCALFTKTHAYPRVSSFARWLDTVIWDENNRPTTEAPTTTASTTQAPQNLTEPTEANIYVDPRKFMLTLPFEPINVPLEPAEDNSVIPRMSLYESYLQSLAKSKTSTTVDPNVLEEEKKEWLNKFGKSILMMPPQEIQKAIDHEQLEYK